MNLNITDISNIERENTWRDALVMWFENAENGIRAIFTDKVQTKELCVGGACVSEEEFTNMLNDYRSRNNSSPASIQTTTPDPDPVVEETPSNDIENPPAEEPQTPTEEPTPTEENPPISEESSTPTE
jgi:hypothetical protein